MDLSRISRPPSFLMSEKSSSIVRETDLWPNFVETLRCPMATYFTLQRFADASFEIAEDGSSSKAELNENAELAYAASISGCATFDEWADKMGELNFVFRQNLFTKAKCSLVDPYTFACLQTGDSCHLSCRKLQDIYAKHRNYADCDLGKNLTSESGPRAFTKWPILTNF